MALCKRCRNEAGSTADICVACQQNEREFGEPYAHLPEPEQENHVYSLADDGPANRPGRIVTTKTGLKGVAFHDDPPVNGKVVVYVKDKKMLCDPAGLKVVGYVD